MLSYRRTMSEKRETMVSALRETARYVTSLHITYGLDLSDLNMSVQLTMNSRLTGLDILLTNADGMIEACSESAFINMGSSVPSEILSDIDSGEHSVVMSTLGSMYPTRRLAAGIPLSVSVGGEMRTYGYLFVTSDMSVLAQEWRKFTTAFILSSLSVMILAFAIAFVTSKRQTAPLIEMASAARRFARGEFDVRVDELPGGRRDEVEQLIESFNHMADSIQNNEQLRRDFIANLSHELKTPMTVISGFAEGLLDGTIAHENEERYLRVISSETKRLSRLVKSMLDISVLGEADGKTMLEGSFDISEIVRLALLNLESRIEEKHLGVEATLPDEPVMTRGHKDSITQVVYNLIDNAIKYSVFGELVKVELWQKANRVFVSVTNHGKTIPAEELPYIFQRFHKVDKSRSVDREGVGLGLYIVKMILDKHNEDIFVTSSDGATTFIFSLTAV